MKSQILIVALFSELSHWILTLYNQSAKSMTHDFLVNQFVYINLYIFIDMIWYIFVLYLFFYIII